MRKNYPILYFLIPLFYVLVLFFLILFQFSKNESFSHSFGDLSVTGKAPSGNQSDGILDFQIKAKGLKFSFSTKNPVILTTTEGEEYKTRPINWTDSSEGIRVVFQNQLVLLFRKSGNNNENLEIISQLPKELLNIKRLSIPFSSEDSTKVSINSYAPIMILQNGNSNQLVSLNGASNYFTSQNYIILTKGSDDFQKVTFENIPKDAESVAFWMHSNAPGNLDSQLSSYFSAAYQGWKSDRFNGNAWNSGNGSYSVNENLLLAYLKQSLNRGEFPQVYNIASNFKNHYPDSYSLLPFLGNLMDSYQKKKRQLELEASRDISWADNYTLFNDSLYYGPEGFSDKVQHALTTNDYPQTLTDQLPFLNNLLQFNEEKPSPVLQKRINELLQLVCRNLVKKENKLFLNTQDSISDVKETFYFGLMIKHYSFLSSNPSISIIGQFLISSCLSMQTSSGFLPQAIMFSQNSLKTEDILLPENIFVFQNFILNQPEYSLRKWGSDAFIYTPASVSSQNISNDGASFNLKFPKDSAEFIVIHGVPAFDHILMHGIRWRSDPDFQSYSDGWFYNPDSKTLFVKIKHRQDEENLTISMVP